jgi:cyclophilin family peptidyl-prolyl cis-trans isomerase
VKIRGRLVVSLAGAGVTALAMAGAIGAAAPAGATGLVEAGASTGVLFPLASAHKAGFTKSVYAPSTTTSTNVAGCPDGAQEEFASASGKLTIVSEVLYCATAAGAAGLLQNFKSSSQVVSNLHPPKALGSSALERMGSGSSYLIVWQRGTAIELIGLSTNPPSSSTTSTTTGAAVPLTAQQQKTLTSAALQQNSRFKVVSVLSTSTGSTADAKAQTTANAVAVASGCPKDPSTPLTKAKWASAPAQSIDPTKSYTATVKTDVGSFVIALDAKDAPKTVNNFIFLVKNHFYDCVIFHRVIPNFVDQTGDPTGTGAGGPGYTIPDELPAKASNPADQYPLGSVAMANTGQPNTGGSQWFIVAGPQGESLPDSYSLFGHVISGMKVVEKINAQGSASGVPPDVTHRMLKVTLSSS